MNPHMPAHVDMHTPGQGPMTPKLHLDTFDADQDRHVDWTCDDNVILDRRKLEDGLGRATWKDPGHMGTHLKGRADRRRRGGPGCATWTFPEFP